MGNNARARQRVSIRSVARRTIILHRLFQTQGNAASQIEGTARSSCGA